MGFNVIEGKFKIAKFSDMFTYLKYICVKCDKEVERVVVSGKNIICYCHGTFDTIPYTENTTFDKV